MTRLALRTFDSRQRDGYGAKYVSSSSSAPTSEPWMDSSSEPLSVIT